MPPQLMRRAYCGYHHIAANEAKAETPSADQIMAFLWPSDAARANSRDNLLRSPTFSYACTGASHEEVAEIEANEEQARRTMYPFCYKFFVDHAEERLFDLTARQICDLVSIRPPAEDMLEWFLLS